MYNDAKLIRELINEQLRFAESCSCKSYSSECLLFSLGKLTIYWNLRLSTPLIVFPGYTYQILESVIANAIRIVISAFGSRSVPDAKLLSSYCLHLHVRQLFGWLVWIAGCRLCICNWNIGEPCYFSNCSTNSHADTGQQRSLKKSTRRRRTEIFALEIVGWRRRCHTRNPYVPAKSTYSGEILEIYPIRVSSSPYIAR